MWTPATRRQHSREALRYETDLTDGEWALGSTIAGRATLSRSYSLRSVPAPYSK
jgi:hypothetical protein